MPRPPAPKKPHNGCPPGAGTIPGGRGGKIGNPPFEPTQEQREQVLAEAVHWGHTALARRMGIDHKTLIKHFREELDMAAEQMVADVSAKLYEKAMAGDGANQRFILERVGKGIWLPKQLHEHTGPGGEPIKVDLTSFLEGKTEEELARIKSLIVELASAGGIALPGIAAVSVPPNNEAGS